MGEVTESDLMLFLYVTEEGTPVVDPEREYTMLIRKGERGAEYGTILSADFGGKVEAVKG
jgi:hypothetical protein